MENVSLTLVTDDMDYGRAVSRAMTHLCSQMSVRIIGKDDFFILEKQQSEHSCVPADIILWDGAEAEEAYGGRIVLISEKAALARKNFADERFCIYRYSTAQVMIASVFEIYSALTGKTAVHVNRGQARLLAFSSCRGGTGCTSLAVAVGQELSRFRGMRVMRISLEHVESTGDFAGEYAGIKGAGVYLYHLFKNDKKNKLLSEGVNDSGKSGYPIVDSYIVRDEFGVEMFAPTNGRNPLRNLTEEELDVFVAALIDSGRYDAIIMDLGNNLDDIDISCMEMAHRICLVSTGDSGDSRENGYLQHLIRCCDERVTDKMVRVENMAAADGSGSVEKIVGADRKKSLPTGRQADRQTSGQADRQMSKQTEVKTGRQNDMQSGMITTSALIRNCSGSFFSDIGAKRILLEGELGDDIRRLAQILTEPVEQI